MDILSFRVHVNVKSLYHLLFNPAIINNLKKILSRRGKTGWEGERPPPLAMALHFIKQVLNSID